MMNSWWKPDTLSKNMLTPQGILEFVVNCTWTLFVPRDYLNLV